MQTAARPTGPIADYFDARYGTVPLPKDFQAAACWLADHWYSEESIRAIAAYWSTWGTVHGCKLFTFETDRDCVEDLLPRVAEAYWAIYDVWSWTTN
jgi:hypothetical protein